jgi:poly-gamma-glutamate synthesis protein (capsule biosynthesis protein)
VTGLDQFGPGVLVDDPVGQQQTALLEAADRVLGVRAEEPVGPFVSQEEVECSQTGLDVDDLLASVTYAYRTHLSIILITMPPTATPTRKRRGDRRRIFVAVAIWVVALLLAGLYFSNAFGQQAASAPEPGPPSPTTAAYTTASTTPPATSPPSTALPPTTTTTAAPTTTTSGPPPALTVAAGGDVHGDRNVGTYIDKHGGKAALAKVKPFLEDAHVAFINLEGPISDKGSPVDGKEYTFESRTALAAGLADAGIDVVSLANNHSRDYGASALLDTFERLKAVGVKWAGAGANAEAAYSPAILDTPAGTVAILAFSAITTWYGAGSDSAGTATTTSHERVLAAVRAAAKKADYVIVSFHWGTEYEGTAGSGQRSLAHKVIDAGADLILGHHPHVIQGMEIYKDKLIAYSLGDFVFDHYKRVTGEAFVLQVTLDKSGPPTAEIIPVYLSDPWGIPAPVKGSEAKVILDRLAKYSSALGLELKRSGDHAFIE